MPNLAEYHPIIVHFVIALGVVGILLRILSLLGKGAWMNSAAVVLIILAAGASVAGVKSGTDAHGPAERVPGAREAVQEHEDWGHKSRTILLVVAGLELLGLIFASNRAGKAIRVLSAVGGAVALFYIYETGEHGGDLVYQYAGGVGLRSGDPADLKNLLVAALYHNARLARDSGRSEDAARWTEELARVRPDDPSVKLLAVESKLRDRKDAEGALADLAALQIAPDDPRLAPRAGLLTSQALIAAGRQDSAKAVLTALAARFPNNQGIKTALAKLP